MTEPSSSIASSLSLSSSSSIEEEPVIMQVNSSSSPNDYGDDNDQPPPNFTNRTPRTEEEYPPLTTSKKQNQSSSSYYSTISTRTKVMTVIGIPVLVAIIIVGITMVTLKLKYNNDQNYEVVTVNLPIPTEIEIPFEFSPSEYYMNNVDSSVTTDGTINFRIALSQPNTLITITKKGMASQTSSTRPSFQPVGRSYDGRAWEVTSGKFVNTALAKSQPSALFWNCDSTHCLWNYSALLLEDMQSPEADIYSITTYQKPYWYGPKDIAARFLEQATMGGGTSAEMNDLVNSDLDFASWIQNQQSLPASASSHRAIFRNRLNSQHRTASVIGPVTQPCTKGTRYRLTALSKYDALKVIELSTIDENKRRLTLLDGEENLSMIVPTMHYAYSINNDKLWRNEFIFEDGEYIVCRIDEDLGDTTPGEITNGKSMIRIGPYNLGDWNEGQISENDLDEDGHPDPCNWRNAKVVVFVDTNFFGTTDNPVLFSNPILRFDSGEDAHEPTLVLELSDEDAKAINDEYYVDFGTTSQEIILENHIAAGVGGSVCSSSLVDGTKQRIFAKWRGRFYRYEPRFQIFGNTVESPLPDGGGEVFAHYEPSTTNTNDDELYYEARYYGPTCSNVQRSFLNEETCFLSNSPHVCTSDPTDNENDTDFDWNRGKFRLTDETIRIIHEETRQDDTHDHTLYLYAIDGLDITRDQTVQSPCTAGATSRWIPITCSSGEQQSFIVLGEGTVNLFSRLIDQANRNSNQDPYFVDVQYPSVPQEDFSCDDEDVDLVGYEVPDWEQTVQLGGEQVQQQPQKCWKNVHPDHLNVHDFTTWTRSHPGNSDQRNPITEFAEAGMSRLMFPDWHELTRWYTFKEMGGISAKLGEDINIRRLPAEIRTERLVQALGIELDDDNGDDDPVTAMAVQSNLVCGSPNEVANNPELGGTIKFGAFTTPTHLDFDGQKFRNQREIAWIMAVLTDAGQLRQRIAWVLSQILVISPDSFPGLQSKLYTEPFLMYYDIFIRNAFGNYRDVLKEVSYSPMMATMLSYFGGKSTAFVQSKDNKVQYPDENYAREIMQLFTTGLFKMNFNGTQRLDQDGMSQRVYTNGDIEEYARAWTGFVSQESRGNIEGDLVRSNRVDPNLIDPMRIISDWRDLFPKMGLDRVYVGDHYPLCKDLPRGHFLKPGATYRLLGRSANPEMQEDPPQWENNDAAHITLDRSSQLYSVLCDSNGERCTFPAKVVLRDAMNCHGIECEVDTLRSVEVEDGIFYEYIRLPCASQAFFNDAKVLVHRRWMNTYVCGDPGTESGTVACCGNNDRVWHEMFYGERTIFSTAHDRCGGALCADSNKPRCNDGNRCSDKNYFWSSLPCSVLAKINSVGKVAIVHGSNNVADGRAESRVGVDSQTFFRVDWNGDYAEIISDCREIDSCIPTYDGSCICQVDVFDDQVFHDVPTQDEINSALYVGAFGSGTTPPVNTPISDDTVLVHNLNADATMTMETVFEFIDENGRRQLRKNVRSTVRIRGVAASFRNPPHLMNIADPEPRDAHYETDAVLDHYLYHPSTPPFLAIRFAQRFGVSNPSPNYIESVARAFQTGRFAYGPGNPRVHFGTGEYGDLGAAFAAVLLHPEARNVVLDSDPTHGSFKEPILLILGLMRSLGFERRFDIPWTEFGESFGQRIGQMAHQIPSVFSFFLPEHQPPGPIAQAGLVAPEAQRQTGPRIISTLNGIFSMIKYGLNSCFGGFGAERGSLYAESMDCTRLQIGIVDNSTGSLAYEASSKDIIDELATLMTAGRLGPDNRAIAASMVSEQSAHAIRKAQLLIASSPEFHATNIVRKTGEERPSESLQAPSSRPYKALVHVMLSGGCDSFNMLVPHSCDATNSAGQTLLEQYLQLRSSLALTERERSRLISSENQPCDEFGIHNDLPILERLYNAGELSFFANAGALDVPVTKNNYYALTQTELFAHNMMQAEAQRIDPFNFAPDTGILGRLCDILRTNGYNPQPISIQDAAISTVGGQAESISPIIISTGEGVKFAPAPQSEDFDMREYAARMNDATSAHSSIFGETWSQRLQKAIVDADLITEAFEGVELIQEKTQLSKYEEKMYALSQTILSHDARGSDRDVIYVELPNWDHHSNLKDNLSTKFRELDSALTFFEEEMKGQGMWEQVTMVITSEFGRTLTPNSSSGSDHAWGGNYMVLGGSVKGKQIHGEYPSDLTDLGPLNVGRGRLIPTLSWESVLNGPLEWMGVDTDEDLDYCMPNRQGTGATLLTKNQLFHADTARALRGTVV